MLDDVQQRVSTLYPGVTLESPIQGWVFLRKFDRGIQCYQAMKERSPVDDRWAGVCYFHLHEDLRAVELFYRAISRGIDAARINLAHALAYIERGDEVIPELMRVDRSSLSTYDKVLFFRVKSLHEETSGDLLTALSDAETAWALVQGVPQYAILAPDILSQLAVLHGRVGRAQDALEFIDKNLDIANEVDAFKAKIHRAHILITLGKFAAAIRELNALNLKTCPKHLQPIVVIHRAEAEWALGNYPQATTLFESSVELAASLSLGYEEFLARTSLAFLYSVDRQFDSAKEHLRVAESLVGDRSDRLHYRFREIVIKRTAGEISATEAIHQLNIVAYELEKMGARQEQGCVRLHISHLMWGSGMPAYEEELREVGRLSHMLQNYAFLTRELTVLGDFARIVTERTPIKLPLTSTLQLITLNDEGIFLDGEPVHIPLRRTLELLTFLLENGPVNITTVENEIFPSEKSRSARSYFHQFRHQLNQSLEGLCIAYDRSTNTYSVVSEYKVDWDYWRLRDSNRLSNTHMFLPSAFSPWVSNMNERIFRSSPTT